MTSMVGQPIRASSMHPMWHGKVVRPATPEEKEAEIMTSFCGRYCFGPSVVHYVDGPGCEAMLAWLIPCYVMCCWQPQAGVPWYKGGLCKEDYERACRTQFATAAPAAPAAQAPAFQQGYSKPYDP